MSNTTSPPKFFAFRNNIGRVPEISRFIGRKPLVSLASATAGSIFVAGIEIGVAIFFQLFLKALGLTSEMTGSWTWLSDLSLSPLQISFALAVIGLIRGSANVFVAQHIVVANESLVLRLREQLFSHLLLTRHPRQIEGARLNFLIADIIPKMGLFLANIVNVLTVGVMIICVGTTMLSTAWQHSIIGLAGLFFIGLIVLRLNKSVLKASRELPVEQAKLMTSAQRVSRNWHLIRILRTGPTEYKSIRNSIENYFHASIKGSKATYLGSETPPTMGIFLLIIMIYIQLSLKLVPNGHFLVFLYLFMRFAQYVGGLAKGLGVLSTYLPAVATGMRELKNFSGGVASTYLNSGQPLPTLDAASTRKSPPSITFDNVSFSYPDSSKAVLNSLSINIAPGEHFGIYGKSGTGKSTLTSLMLGVLDPSKGMISIDGVQPSEYFQSHSPNVGYVGAEPFLISGSIFDNLSYGLSTKPSEKHCWDALEMARVADVVQSKKEGLQFKLTENGEGLSAGQKQRLSLARALLRSPSLLILDEVSANIDEQTEAEIANVIWELKGKVTSVIVSHRPKMLESCNRLLELPTQEMNNTARDKSHHD
jgi:ABC-type multidrug transport system fused ATPase/permease subunit